MSADTEFGVRFKRLLQRAEVPLQQEAVGKFLGVSGTMAWNYMNGEKLPSMKNAIKFALKLRCPVEYLLTGRGPDFVDDVTRRAVDSEIERMEKEGDLIDLRDLDRTSKVAVKAVVDALAEQEGINDAECG